MTNFHKLQQNINTYIKKSDLTIIQESFQKLEFVVNEKCVDDILPGLAKLLLATYKLGIDYGVNLDKALYLIHESNMSKLCNTEELAKDTVADYVRLYESGESPYDTPEYKLSDDEKYYIVFNGSTKKILKSIKYNVVDLKSLVFNEGYDIELDNVSNLQKVTEFNKTFNSTIYEKFSLEILNDVKFVSLRLGLIREEINELIDAYENKDLVEIVDALGDILYVAYGMVHTFGLSDFIDGEIEKNLV